MVTRYQKRISGPLLDRFDIHMDVPHLQRQHTLHLRSAMNQLGMSARAFHRVLKLGRTIADLAGQIEFKRRTLRLRSGQVWPRRSTSGRPRRQG
jgi:predicted ATPase with chaperone activity